MKLVRRSAASRAYSAAIVILSFLVAGCALPSASISTNKSADNLPDLKQLVIAPATASLEQETAAFGKSFAAAASKCGVKVVVSRDQVSDTSVADTMLIVGRLNYETINGTTRKITYLLTMANIETKRILWKAEVPLNLGGGVFRIDDSGALLSAVVVHQMINDGILPGCH